MHKSLPGLFCLSSRRSSSAVELIISRAASLPLAPTPTCKDLLPHQIIPPPRSKMRSKKGNIPPLLRRYHHLSFPSYPNQRKVEVSFNSIPPLRAPGHYQKLNSAKVSHPSRCLSTLCQALLRTILRTLLGISWMLHLPHPPLSPSFHVPRHHRDNPFRPFANSIQSQPNASAHQSFTYAPCAREALVGRGVRLTLYRVCEGSKGIVSVVARYVERGTERGVGKVKHPRYSKECPQNCPQKRLAKCRQTSGWVRHLR